MAVLPARLAMAATAALSRASSFAISAMPSFLRSASLLSSMSVANTVAPSRAKATAQARPIPTAAAVTNARLPFRRSDISFSLEQSRLFLGVIRGLDPRIHLVKKHGFPAQPRHYHSWALLFIPPHPALPANFSIPR